VSGPPPTRHGRSAYDIVSALQKAVRRSQPEQAAAFAIELTQSGHGHWLWKRLRVICVEDCSPEATGLVADVAALHEQWKASKGDDLLAVARAAVALALAPKSRVVDWLVLLHVADDAQPVEVPDEALDMHTRQGRRMGRGRQHFAEEASRLVPWEGDLAAWEADVRKRALARWLSEPRRSAPTPPAVDQLRIEGEIER
jgi:replication-associated recombination protein RarA